jgi:hypothetical protein
MNALAGIYSMCAFAFFYLNQMFFWRLITYQVPGHAMFVHRVNKLRFLRWLNLILSGFGSTAIFCTTMLPSFVSNEDKASWFILHYVLFAAISLYSYMEMRISRFLLVTKRTRIEAGLTLSLLIAMILYAGLQYNTIELAIFDYSLLPIIFCTSLPVFIARYYNKELKLIPQKRKKV